MGSRIRGVAAVVAVLGVGAYLGTSAQGWWTRSSGTLDDGAPTWDGDRVRVEVLNGGGRSGMAREATDELRSRGFDVVYWGNAGSFGRDSSVVLDRIGRADLARSVAEALGITAVRTQADSTLLLDVSVVLGQDWEPVEAVVSPPEPPWWDVRRFFRHDGDVPVGPMADPGEDANGRE